MRALVFAAGRGERMRPLTDHTPKPLLCVGGKPLIAWHLEKLAAIDVRDVVINTSWLAPCFAPVLGDGGQWGLRLHYRFEGATPLETGGGMLNALPLLGDGPFLAVNGDIWTDADFSCLPREPEGLAHLMLVDNPSHHPRGDFALDAAGRMHDRDSAVAAASGTFTFSGLGIYRPQLFDHWRAIIEKTPDTDASPPRFKLAPLLRAGMRDGRLSGERHTGRWFDIGTPERLAALDTALQP